jgi:hypothetical protein
MRKRLPDEQGFRRPDLEELQFPDDTLFPPDTTPRIDIGARREALTEGGFPQRDSLFRALQERAGFFVIEYRGREVRLDLREETIGLSGEAQVNRASEVLTADSISYLGPVRFMMARRNIELVGADQKEVLSDSVLYYDMGSRKGTVYNAETHFMNRGTNWRVIGDVIPKAQDTVYAKHSSFTSCEIEEPHYSFKAGRLKLVNQNVIVAWPVVLYVSNVPILWMPFFASDIRPGRRSGILPPRFGFNDVVQTSSGARRNVTDVGYYWAISPFMDAQATLDWFSGNYTRINAAFRYRFLKKFIRGSVIYGHSFASDGRNLTLNWDHNQELGLNTTLRTSARYVQNTRLLQDQTFDPRNQTQTIDSDAGLRHRFSFADISLSARRRQFLTQGSRTELTLPSMNVSFSPVTLLPAPRTRQGLLNNITLSGSGNFSRRTSSQDLADDQTTTAATVSTGIRLRDFNVSSSARLNDLSTTPEDSLGMELPAETQTTISWSTRADYQIKLMGSTTLRPSVSLDGAQFRSIGTGGDFVSAPTRASVGATLSTDVYGFYPGFGPFSRVRHKVSPGFSWAYAPQVAVDSTLAAIPGFPAGSGAARNTLTFTLRQTFEAKVKRSAREEETDVPAQGATETLEGAAEPPGQPGDSVGVSMAAPESAADTVGTPAPGGARAARPVTGRGPDAVRPVQRQPDERIITILAINTSAFRWDFERAKLGEPTLVTDEVSNSVTSDLLRGLSINMTHDLFEGSGSDRKFKPFLKGLAASFRLRSGTGLRDLFGLGEPRRRQQPQPAQRLDSRYRLSEFESENQVDPFESPEAGPWDLTLRYSIVRARQGEPGLENQTIDGTLAFHPTPKWSVRWSTQYNFTDGEFGRHLITLDRDLHRWRASFQFARSPNGNVIFQVAVALRDAPEVHADYNQRTVPSSR